MRRPDTGPLEPEIAEALRAVDATLAGEAVAPEHAETAELALMLRAIAPAPRQEFAAALDDRVTARFSPSAPGAHAAVGTASAQGAAATGAPSGSGRPLRARLLAWPSTQAFGSAAAGLAALIVAIVVVAGSTGGSGTRKSPAILHSAGAGSPAHSAPLPAPAPVASAPAASAPAATATGGSGPAVTATGGSGPAVTALQPSPNGRKVIQSAAITLGTKPDRIDEVAQEVFNTIAGAGGIVDSSTVTQTGGLDGYAHLSLRVPSSALQRTMGSLSRLQDAAVLSRTDSTQDVNTQFVDARRALADAQALRAALLRQLAAATTQAQIDSLKARIHDAEAEIAAAQSKLRGLERQVDYSRIDLTVQASSNAGIGPVGGGGFTLRRAADDALHVLTLAAGVALIALAAIVPVGLIAALAAWTVATVRRRRREQALDLA